MNQTEFERKCTGFYADFGTCGHGKLPNPAQVISKFSTQTGSDDAISLVQEFVETTSYFVRICWTSCCIGDFPCSQEQYNQ
ncbi:hypothetical protein LEP3755_67190 (plasmid) [Leptolyngbya sp. NIES-3755]|nr:hypothetical protein LEP3755_67190 [Leptolyngbya sp. NIES-3755]